MRRLSSFSSDTDEPEGKGLVRPVRPVRKPENQKTGFF
jgi:hypothetical protein